LFKAMADSVSTEHLFDGLGSDFYIMGQYIKFHAACRHIHPTIDGLLSVMRAQQLKFEDLDRVDVTTYPVAVSFCGAPTLPETAEGAKFSLAFSVAMAAYFGDAGEHRYTQSVVQNEDIRTLAARVTSRTDARWEQAYPKERGAAITISCKNGKSFFIEVPLPKGEPENPATDEDFILKFQQNTAGQSAQEVQTLLAIVRALETHTIADLTQAVVRCTQ
jgi:2-methylcitrate dehydratase PrpD